MKKIIGKWIQITAKNNLAQALVMQENPTIALSLLALNKKTDQTKCSTKT